MRPGSEPSKRKPKPRPDENVPRQLSFARVSRKAGFFKPETIPEHSDELLGAYPNPPKWAPLTLAVVEVPLSIQESPPQSSKLLSDRVQEEPAMLSVRIQQEEESIKSRIWALENLKPEMLMQLRQIAELRLRWTKIYLFFADLPFLSQELLWGGQTEKGQQFATALSKIYEFINVLADQRFALLDSIQDSVAANADADKTLKETLTDWEQYETQIAPLFGELLSINPSLYALYTDFVRSLNVNSFQDQATNKQSFLQQEQKLEANHRECLHQFKTKRIGLLTADQQRAWIVNWKQEKAAAEIRQHHLRLRQQVVAKFPVKLDVVKDLAEIDKSKRKDALKVFKKYKPNFDAEEFLQRKGISHIAKKVQDLLSHSQQHKFNAINSAEGREFDELEKLKLEELKKLKKLKKRQELKLDSIEFKADESVLESPILHKVRLLTEEISKLNRNHKVLPVGVDQGDTLTKLIMFKHQLLREQLFDDFELAEKMQQCGNFQQLERVLGSLTPAESCLDGLAQVAILNQRAKLLQAAFLHRLSLNIKQFANVAGLKAIYLEIKEFASFDEIEGALLAENAFNRLDGEEPEAYRLRIAALADHLKTKLLQAQTRIIEIYQTTSDFTVEEKAVDAVNFRKIKTALLQKLCGIDWQQHKQKRAQGKKLLAALGQIRDLSPVKAVKLVETVTDEFTTEDQDKLLKEHMLQSLDKQYFDAATSRQLEIITQLEQDALTESHTQNQQFSIALNGGWQQFHSRKNNQSPRVCSEFIVEYLQADLVKQKRVLRSQYAQNNQVSLAVHEMSQLGWGQNYLDYVGADAPCLLLGVLLEEVDNYLQPQQPSASLQFWQGQVAALTRIEILLNLSEQDEFARLIIADIVAKDTHGLNRWAGLKAAVKTEKDQLTRTPIALVAQRFQTATTAKKLPPEKGNIITRHKGKHEIAVAASSVTGGVTSFTGPLALAFAAAAYLVTYGVLYIGELVYKRYQAKQMLLARAALRTDISHLQQQRSQPTVVHQPFEIEVINQSVKLKAGAKEKGIIAMLPPTAKPKPTIAPKPLATTVKIQAKEFKDIKEIKLDEKVAVTVVVSEDRVALTTTAPRKVMKS